MVVARVVFFNHTKQHEETRHMIKFYTIEEVASALKLNRKALNTIIREGRIHAVKIGRLWRIPEAEYDRICREGIPPKQAKH